MKKFEISVLVSCILFSLWFGFVQAQEQGDWTAPYNLSNNDANTSGHVVVTDNYGYVHAFWIEHDSSNQRHFIQYSRFDGEIWSAPIDVYVTEPGNTGTNTLGQLSATSDSSGNLHLVWAGGFKRGPVGYAYAPAHNAASARNWSLPVISDIPADGISLQVDSYGTLHLLYSRHYDQPGVFYIKSKDKGVTWTDPVWFDPDILPDHVPSVGYTKLAIDENDGLHAMWFYTSVVEVNDDWIRYTHSLDGGDTWSDPLTIDKDEERTGKLFFTGAIMAIQGQKVHIVWAGGNSTFRNHRFSTDRGITWSVPTRIGSFRSLDGQAGDSLTVDGMGRVHYFGQIRYPQGIWHAYWDQDHWSTPELIYLISRDYTEPRGDRIHAHGLRAVVRKGNQLIVLFRPPQSDEDHSLYAMHRTIDNIPSVSVSPTPTPLPTPTSTPQPDPTPTLIRPTPSATPSLAHGDVPPSDSNSNPNVVLLFAIVPVLMVVGGTITVQLIRER